MPTKIETLCLTKVSQLKLLIKKDVLGVGNKNKPNGLPNCAKTTTKKESLYVEGRKIMSTKVLNK